MSITDETTIGDRTYYSGTIHNNTKVTLVFSRWGKVAAASTTTTLINQFNVDFVLFTGVAGAVNSALNIGDIVVGTKCYQHDMDARPLFPRFQIPLTETAFFISHENDIKKAERATNQFVSLITDNIPSSILEKFAISSPNVYTDIIASGDQFI